MSLSSQAFESSTAPASTSFVSAHPSPLPSDPVHEERYESPTASHWCLSHSKRVIDLMIALLVLGVFALPMLGIALCVRLTSEGPSFFVQLRVGRGGRLFRIFKFRSMTVCTDAHKGPGLTRDGDCRITGVGRWLRKFKLDELPQFYNVLRGEMSLVGPRPKLPQYEALANMPYRPGITGAATLAFRREEEMLSHVHPSQLDEFYNRHIRPLKARIDGRYMCRATFWSDMSLIAATFLACFMSARPRSILRNAPPPVLVMPLRQSAEPRVSHSFEGAD